MWEILEHRRVDQQLASTPLEILKRYEKWNGRMVYVFVESITPHDYRRR